MGENESKSLDVLGLKAYGDAINAVTKGAIDGASAFLGRICLPAAEELGLLFRDRVSHWRAFQAAKIAEKAEEKLKTISDSEHGQAHPRLVGLTIEHGSWVDTDEVQEMWAGLLVSSCTKDGKDESNLMFINLLSQLTASQARVLSYGCEKSEKVLSTSGLVAVYSGVYVSLKELTKITGIGDIYRLDRELDHLRVLGLLAAGMFPNPIYTELGPTYTEVEPTVANLMPAALGLQMYVRCQGSRKSPAEYFELIKSE